MSDGPVSTNPHPYGTTAWLVEERKTYAAQIDELRRRAERAEWEREEARDQAEEYRLAWKDYVERATAAEVVLAYACAWRDAEDETRAIHLRAAVDHYRARPVAQPDQEGGRRQPLNPFSGVSAPIGRPPPEEVERRVVEQIAAWLEDAHLALATDDERGSIHVSEAIRRGLWKPSTPDTEEP